MAPTSPRRVILQSADDLFRPTDPTAEELAAEAHVRAVPDATSRAETSEADAPGKRKPSGRVRHDEKMTVYVTADELLDLFSPVFRNPSLRCCGLRHTRQ